MKYKNLFVLAMLLPLAGLARPTEDTNANHSANTMKTNDSAKVMQLDKAAFQTKVYDFEKNPGQWVFNGDKPAIVDFYATWCGPCKALAPIMDELAGEYAGQIDIYKVDIDQSPELAAAFGIRSVPSILFIPLGEKPQMAQGALPKATFKQAIDEILLKK